MSSLSVLNPEFIQYLYKNNIKLETYESPVNDKIISGFWAFLDKYENKYLIRMYYYINKQYKYLRVSFIRSYPDFVTKDVKKVAYITILYMVSIYHLSDINNINFDNFECPEYNDCFLCENKGCLLCKLCKNNINDIITDNTLISKLQSSIISSPSFDTRFIRNFLYKNEYRIFVQEFLQPMIPQDKIIYQNFRNPYNNIDGIFGRITLRREKEIINIDYTLSYTKKTLHMTIKECTFQKETLTLLEMMILHFISGYSVIEIIVRFSSDKNYIYELLHKIGFNHTNGDEKFYVIFNFVDLEDPSIILKINYDEILPYIQDQWNILKDI